MSRLEPVIGGQAVAHTLLGDHYGDVTWSHGERGCQQASFGFWTPPGVRISHWRRGALFVLEHASDRRWAGVVGEVDYNEGVVHAHGFGAEAERFLALDGSGNATATPSVAVDQAIIRGWGATSRTGVPTAAYTAAAEGVNTVGALLSAQADEIGRWWYIGADRIVRMAAAPTAPVWQIVEPMDLGTADDDYTSALVVRYRNGVSTYSSVTVVDQDAADRFGYREEAIDATGLGVITSARATDIGEGLLTKGRSRLGWTQALEVASTQLLTMGDRPADLSLVKSHEMVRVHGINDDLRFLFGRSYLDVVIGETNYADGADTISLSPMGSVAQSFDEVIADLAAKAAA